MGGEGRNEVFKKEILWVKLSWLRMLLADAK